MYRGYIQTEFEGFRAKPVVGTDCVLQESHCPARFLAAT